MSTIAFFGSTGGCTNSCLALVLTKSKDIQCRALVRTPTKLEAMLKDQGINEDIIKQRLTIIKGDAQDKKSILDTITYNDGKNVVSKIISGIGSSPKMQLSITSPVAIKNPNICENFTKALLEAMPGVSSKCSLLAISSTGITDGPDDVPFGYSFLYKYLLKSAHQDKKKMEVLLQRSKVFDPTVIVRPTLLSGSQKLGSGVGYEKIKAGTDSKPIKGYSISRCDVGDWIYHKFILEGDSLKSGVSIFTLTS